MSFHLRLLPRTETIWIAWHEVLLIDFCYLICFLKVIEYEVVAVIAWSLILIVISNLAHDSGGILGIIFVSDFCSLVVSLALDAEFNFDIFPAPAGFHVWASGMKRGQIFCSIFCKTKYLDLMSAYMVCRLSVFRYCRESYHEIVKFQPCYSNTHCPQQEGHCYASISSFAGCEYFSMTW